MIESEPAVESEPAELLGPELAEGEAGEDLDLNDSNDWEFVPHPTDRRNARK